MERFWNKVNKNGPLILDTPCWEWTAYCCSKGYGIFRMNGAIRKAHRVSYMLCNPTSAFYAVDDILHACDNRKCVNPAHLFEGSHKDNMKDMANKGRAKTKKGEEHKLHKLTEKQVSFIRDSNCSLRELAKIFNVSKTLIMKIRQRKVWRHI